MFEGEGHRSNFRLQSHKRKKLVNWSVRLQLRAF